METKNIICIGCPMGCPLTVTIDGENISVTGNTCPIGDKYAKKEVTDPRRVVTSSVKAVGGELARVPVKTDGDIPKGKIFDCMREISTVEVKAPVKIGDVIIENCADTGVNIIATRNVGKK